MHFIRSFLLIILCCCVFAACTKDEWGSCFRKTGGIVREKRLLTGFDSISLERRIELYLVPDSITYVEVEAGSGLLPLIRTERIGKKLTVGNDNRCHWVRSYEVPVKVYVHHSNIRHILSHGTGLIKSTDTIRFPQLTIEFRDASTVVDLSVNNEKLNVIQHTGASDLRISGKTAELSVYMAALAWGDYRRLEAGRVYVESRSAADCFVFSRNRYDFRLKAAGNIHYSGDAPVIEKEITGSGKLIKSDQ